MNSNGLKSIDYAKQMTQIILKKEDKYEYTQAIMNLTLSTARIYNKLFDRDEAVTLKHLESSFKDYEWLSQFMRDFMKERKIESGKDLPTGMSEPFRMMQEMVELLPLKISKLNARLNK